MQVAPSQISPGENFDVFYFLRNHTDGATYYVRARIYDVRTGELLDTQNLEQASANSRLFIKTVTAPADPTGYGRSIVAIATVYTDSGYTTKSDNYEEQEQYFLIKATAPVFGGAGVDYDHLRDIVKEVLRETLPVPQPMPWDAIFGTLGVLQRELNRIPKDVLDLQPLVTAIADLKQTIRDLPKPHHTDLTPVMAELNKLDTAIKHDKKLAAALSADHREALDGLMAETLPRIEAAIRAAFFALPEQEQKPPLPVPADLSHLF